ncbi:MAG: hypothetical protein L3J04_04475 [Robiginitomaculum sp.]|nr:hypothetical protein [Robiginitomaculum sp.]
MIRVLLVSSFVILFAAFASKAVADDPCPQNYAPICGLDKSGNEKTYSNMCQLRDQHGDAIYKGKCRNTPTNQASCPRNYSPVCGATASTTARFGAEKRTTYSNDCERKKANARLLYNGQCRNPPANQTACPANYAPVCGQTASTNSRFGAGTNKTYSNDCQRRKANARLLYNGRCR